MNVRTKILLLAFTFIIASAVLVIVFNNKLPGVLTVSNTNTERVYSNNELGIKFYYPSSYQNPIQEEISKADNSPGILNGKGIRIYFGEDQYAAWVLGVSGDFNSFKEASYLSENDYPKLCPRGTDYDEQNMNQCVLMTISGRKAVQRYFVEIDEGVVFVNRITYLPLSSTEFPILIIGQTYPKLADQLQSLIDRQEEFATQAKVVIEQLQNKKNLDEITERQVHDYGKMLTSLNIK